MAAGLWAYPQDPALYLGMWVAMMTAMMSPSIAPTVAGYGRAVPRRTALARGAAFTGGYLAVWYLAGLVLYALLGLAGGLLMDDMTGRNLAAGVLVVAAVYQLAPSKRACLRRLRGPQEPGGGWTAALRGGLESGWWSLGCCWALMASLVALGMMSLTWMVVIWLLVMAERYLPAHRLAAVGSAAILAALAIHVV